MKFAFVLQHTYDGFTELLLNSVFLSKGSEQDMRDLMRRFREGIECGVAISLDVRGIY